MGPEVPGQQRAVRGHLERPRRLFDSLRFHNGGRWLAVIEQGRLGGKALDPHELLTVEPTAGPLEPDVSFPGNVAYLTVIRHRRKPYVPRSHPGPAEPQNRRRPSKHADP